MTNLDRLVTVECPRHHLPADDRDGDYIWQCDICRAETKLMNRKRLTVIELINWTDEEVSKLDGINKNWTMSSDKK